jgi:hypothetical protein
MAARKQRRRGRERDREGVVSNLYP